MIKCILETVVVSSTARPAVSTAVLEFESSIDFESFQHNLIKVERIDSGDHMSGSYVINRNIIKM